jgi:hypothetical protein
MVSASMISGSMIFAVAVHRAEVPHDFLATTGSRLTLVVPVDPPTR